MEATRHNLNKAFKDFFFRKVKDGTKTGKD